MVLAACSGGATASTVPTTIATATTSPAPTTATTDRTTTVAPTTAAPTTAPPTTAAPTTAPAVTAAPVAEPPTTAAAPTVTIVKVVDGDTVDLSTGERVRIIGIDTPERGQCGFEDAAVALDAMTSGRPVVVTPGARDDTDKYGRILRYIDVDGTDVGLTLIQRGLAIARYDSRDGYGHHPREASYVAADEASPSTCAGSSAATVAPTTAATSSDDPSIYYANCAAARADGAAPLHDGEPGYRSGLDRDHDGVACE